MLSVDTSQVSLSREEMERFSRHLILPEVGLEGQKTSQSGQGLVYWHRGTGVAVIALFGCRWGGSDWDCGF